MLNKILKKKKEDITPQLLPVAKETNLITKIDTNPEFSGLMEKCLTSSFQFDDDYVLYPKTQFKELTDDLQKYRGFEKLCLEQQKEIEYLKQKIQDLENTVKDEKSASIKAQEKLLEEKNEVIKQMDSMEAEKKILERKIFDLNKQLTDNQEVVSRMAEEREDAEAQLDITVQQLEEINAKMFDVYFEYKKYEQIVAKLGVTVNNNKKQNELTEGVEKTEVPTDFKKKIDIHYIFSYGCGDMVAGYLDYKEILNLRLVSKFLNQAIITNPKYFLIIAIKIKQQTSTLREIYSARETSKIPDNYLKHTFSKYIWGKELAGEYMAATLDQCDDVYDQLVTMEDEEGPEQNKPTPVQKPPPKKDNDSILGKLFKKLDEVSGSQLPISKIEEDDFEKSKKYGNAPQDPTGRERFQSYYIQNPRCIYIQCDAYTNPNDKKNMMTRALNIADQMVKDLMEKKSIHPINRTMFFQLLNRFVKLLVYSHLLLQETKELECLKDYLVSKFEETKEKLAKSDKIVEGYINSAEKERNLRMYYHKLLSEAETKLLKIDKAYMDLQEKYTQSEIANADLAADVEYYQKERADLDKKVNFLAKEYKLLKAKNTELQGDYDMISAGFLSVKIAFENLNVN